MRDDLPESRLGTYLHRSRQFSLNFLEGQRLVRDLALTHNVRGAGFAYFRDLVLSAAPMCSLLKPGEGLGFYVDGEDPWFRFKLEIQDDGSARCMMLPEDFRDFPERFTGLVRLMKVYASQAPYQSVVEARGLPLGGAMNQILRESYQLSSEVVLGGSDQSCMVHRLPWTAEDQSEPPPLEEFLGPLRPGIAALLDDGLTGTAEAGARLEALGFYHLRSVGLRFRCDCSAARMAGQLARLPGEDLEDLFRGDGHVEAVCEYCKTAHRIEWDEVRARPLQN